MHARGTTTTSSPHTLCTSQSVAALLAGYNTYTNAGATTALAYAAANASTTSTTNAATSSNAASSQATVMSGGGGPDYAGAYQHSFASADVTATPSTGMTATPATPTTASAAAVAASAASLNSAVVYATSTNATARTFITGSGSYVEVTLVVFACNVSALNDASLKYCGFMQ